MRGTKWAVGAAVVLAGVVGLARAADDEYDLRGPAPVKGQVTVSKKSFKMKNGNVVIKAAGQSLDAKQTLTETEEEEVKVLAVDGRQATKTQTKVTRNQVTTVMSFGGQDMTDTKAGELEGEVIISERTGPGKWKHLLVDTKPTDKQKKDLDKRIGPENQDELYPAGKVKVGHTWTVDAAALQRVLGGSVGDLKGKLKMTFVKVEDVGGEACTVVESSGKITGVVKDDDNEMAMEMEVTGTTWRSLKTGVDLKDKATGRMKMSGKVKMDGTEVELAIDGPITIESTSKLK